MRPLLIFLIRAGLGLLGGYLLTAFFLTPRGQATSWASVALLAALVVAAAYLSEAWRRRKG